MSFFQFRWLRRLIRRHMKPVEQADASLWKKRLSIVYMITAWNAFGIVCYMIFIGKADWAKYYGLKTEEELSLTPAQQWTRTLGIKDTKVYRITGLNMSSYEIHNEFDKDKQVIEEKSTIKMKEA